MEFEQEDQVDWSDGSVEPSLALENHPKPASPYERPSDVLPQAYVPVEPDQREEWNLPTGESLPSNSSQESGLPRFGLTRSQRAKIGVHFNRREPTKEDYSHFVQYQASQKTYEAVFLKSFMGHALHSDQIQACFDDHHNDTRHLEQYLQSVVANVNQITTKMIWNAHSRAVTLLANDGKQNAYFWDFQQFNKNVFSNFTPDNPDPVVHSLEQSWHRVEKTTPMIRYSVKDYPVGKNASVFEELDEVAETLLKPRELDSNLSAGRPVKPPKKSSKSRGRREVALQEERLENSRDNWISGLMTSYNLEVGQRENSHTSPIRQAVSNDNHDVSHDDYDTIDEQIHTALDQDDMTTDGRRSPENVADKVMAPQNHSQHLSIKQLFPHKEVNHSNPTIDVAVEQAVANGILEPPTDDVLELIRVFARIQRIQRRKIARSQKESATMNTNFPPTVSRNNSRPNQKRKAVPPGVQSEPDTMPRKKKRKTKTKASEASMDRSVLQNDSTAIPADHGGPSSRSKTLDKDQVLPSDAYFEPKVSGETCAWLCHSKHALGNYYNAGDRKYCRGCNTSVRLMMPRVRRMDFYLPPGAYCYQPAPSIIWTPNKELQNEKKSKIYAHNSIAKEAFWAASNAGATEDEARDVAVEAVKEHLRPKPKVQPPQPPQPKLKEEIKLPDPGPHPSGSKTMEHGQDLPKEAYWAAKNEAEDRAWRCDVNHALGRYYLAGNKRSCPGCGASRTGPSKSKEMDFYLPPHTVIQQDAPGLNTFKPRRPNKLKRNSEKKFAPQSHNQLCTKNYWAAVDNNGQDHEVALASAIEQTFAEISARISNVHAKHTPSQSSGSSGVEQETSALENVSKTPSATGSSVTTEKSLGDDAMGVETDEEQDFRSLSPSEHDGETLRRNISDSHTNGTNRRRKGRGLNHTIDVVYISSDDDSGSS